MEKDLVNIISEKSFLELTAKEREEIREYITNEDEYNQMKEVFLMMETIDIPKEQPKAETKERLDALFDQTYPRATPVWYMSILGAVVPKDKPFIQQPLLKVAALVVLMFLIYPFLQSDQLGVESKEQLARTEVPTDQNEQATELPLKVQEFMAESNEQEDDVNDRFAETPVIQPLQEERSLEMPIPVEEIELANELLSEPATAGSTIVFSSTAETGFDHPDGVFDETISVPSKSVSADRNPAVLDLLTATF